MSGSVLLFGLLVGLRHALDADHVAGVASLAVRGAGFGQTARVGLSWGLGHTATLLLAGGLAAAAFGEHVRAVSGVAEIVVAVVLVAMGVNVLWRGWRSHVHRLPPPLRRAALLGLLHGLAGSGAVVVLAAASTPGTAAAMGFLLLFGLGSTMAMGLLSGAMAVPLQACARRGPAMLKGLTAVVGSASVLAGLVLLAETLTA